MLQNYFFFETSRLLSTHKRLLSFFPCSDLQHSHYSLIKRRVTLLVATGGSAAPLSAWFLAAGSPSFSKRHLRPSWLARPASVPASSSAAASSRESTNTGTAPVLDSEWLCMQATAERAPLVAPAATPITAFIENEQTANICEEGRGGFGSLSELLLQERQAQKLFSSALTNSLLSTSSR